MLGSIYGLCEPDTGELRYVGLTARSSRERFADHLRAARSSTSHLYNWIRSLDELPTLVVLEEDPPDLDAAERAWIVLFRPGGQLINHAAGGKGGGMLGHPRSEVSKARISATLRGRKKSPEHRAAIGRGVHRTCSMRGESPSRS